MARKKSKQSIAIYVDGIQAFKKSKPINLIEVFGNRLRSQDRKGNDSGTIYFSPTILGSLLKQYDKACGGKGSFTSWIEKTLKSVYFELYSGEIVPLSSVSELHLITPQQQVQVLNNNSILPQNVKLSSIQIGAIPQPAIQKQNNMYEVYICRKGSTTPERVYLGDKLNLAKNGVEDLTLDHVVTTYDMREQYYDDLECIAKIDALIRYVRPQFSSIKNFRSQCNAIAKYIVDNKIIDFMDLTALNKLRDELDLIVRATRGIRVCSKRVNKLSV